MMYVLKAPLIVINFYEAALNFYPICIIISPPLHQEMGEGCQDVRFTGRQRTLGGAEFSEALVLDWF